MCLYFLWLVQTVQQSVFTVNQQNQVQFDPDPELLLWSEEPLSPECLSWSPPGWDVWCGLWGLDPRCSSHLIVHTRFSVSQREAFIQSYSAVGAQQRIKATTAQWNFVGSVCRWVSRLCGGLRVQFPAAIELVLKASVESTPLTNKSFISHGVDVWGRLRLEQVRVFPRFLSSRWNKKHKETNWKKFFQHRELQRKHRFYKNRNKTKIKRPRRRISPNNQRPKHTLLGGGGVSTDDSVWLI